MQRQRSGVPYVVLLAALLLTGAVAYYVEASATAKDRLRFDNAVQRTQRNIEDRVNTYVALLLAGRGFLDASGQVSQADFRAFTNRMELTTRYPGIQGIGFSMRLSGEDLTTQPGVESNPAIRVYPDFPREEYHMVVYLEPLDRRNRAAIGYDMFTEPVRRAAMEKARDTGQPAASGRVTLVQEIDPQKQAGFLIYVPVYETMETPATLSDRRSGLRGFIYSPFRVDDLMRRALEGESLHIVDFEVYDGVEISPGALLHRSNRGAGQPHRSQFTHRTSMDVAGRPWTFVFTSRPELDNASERRLVPFIVLIGSAISLAFFALTRAQVRARIAAERSEEASLAVSQRLNSILERITDGFVAFDPDFRFIYLNRASTQLIKKAPEELLGKTQWEAYPDLVGTQFEQQYRRAMTEQVPVEFEEYYKPLDLWVEVRVFPSPSGLSIYWRDVSDRKRSEAALQDREASFQALVANVPGMVYRYAPFQKGVGRFTFVSSGARDLLELTPAELINNTHALINLIHPEDLSSYQHSVDYAAENFLQWRWEGRIVTPSGQIKWIQGRSSPVVTAEGPVWDGLLIDITERKQAEQELEQTNQTLGTLIEASPLPIVVVDPNCIVRLWNPAATRLFGWREAEVLDRLLPIVPEEKLEECAQLRQAVMQGETFFGVETYRCKQDGAQVVVEISAAPLCDEYGSIVEIVLILQDVTERKQAETERELLLLRERQAREEAETANRIKDEFLAVLSHELRSPLNPILGWAKLLQERNLNEQSSRQGLATIERNAKLQTQLIEDLLDISRILRGKMALHVTPVSLISTIEAAIETVQLAAEAKGIRVSPTLDPEAASVAGDAARLQQIVWNLLSNAIKFTPAGGRVAVRLERVDGFAQIQVQDTGVGISPQFLPYVFDYFRQEDSRTTRRFGGLGLGLAIVRHLSELHGGTVHAASGGEGLGATFTVKIPLLQAAQEANTDSKPPAQALDLSPLKILVVDDEADMRELMLAVLERYGAEVSVAASAAEALELLDRVSPDVLISDIGMPDVDGLLLMRQIRSRSSGRDISAGSKDRPLAIALTAYATEADQRQALAAGFQRHLAKPIEPEILVREIIALQQKTLTK
jgi:PAS domain S-box-containing protein